MKTESYNLIDFETNIENKTLYSEEALSLLGFDFKKLEQNMEIERVWTIESYSGEEKIEIVDVGNGWYVFEKYIVKKERGIL